METRIYPTLIRNFKHAALSRFYEALKLARNFAIDITEKNLMYPQFIKRMKKRFP
jgi:hypothetical protein